MYAIPYEYYTKYKIRRYGFHGTSHRYVSKHCAHLMHQPLEDMNMITCHIGNGSSIAAIRDGKVIDTTMGLTPLDGFMMGTRSGSLDPSIVTFIMEQEGLTPGEMSDILNMKSGMYGICGYSDDRDVTKAEIEGDPRAILAHDMLSYQIAKYIGSYITAMGGLDCLVFTAGLGENQPHLRYSVCRYLKYMGVKIDGELNDKMVGGREGKISTPRFLRAGVDHQHERGTDHCPRHEAESWKSSSMLPRRIKRSSIPRIFEGKAPESGRRMTWAIWETCSGSSAAAFIRAWPGAWRARCGVLHLWASRWGCSASSWRAFPFFPFGKEVRYGGGAGSFLLNLVWVIVSGIPLALAAVLNGALLCVTVVGIPFGLQCFKLAKLAFMPFGSEIVS